MEDSSNDYTSDTVPANTHAHNPTGRNQFGDRRAPASDELKAVIDDYLRRGYTKWPQLKEKLAQDHGGKFTMGRSTFFARKKELGVATVRKNSMTTDEKKAAVRAVWSKDTAGHQGPGYVKDALRVLGIPIARDFIKDVMIEDESVGFLFRHPQEGSGKRIHRTPLVCLGPDHYWAADGHAKLEEIGVGVYSYRDAWSGQILRLDACPSDRDPDIVDYLFLCNVMDRGGIPITVNTDHGTETVRQYATQNSLRERYSELDVDLVPPHNYLPSTRNIIIERSWRPFFSKLGKNIKRAWFASAASGYAPHNPLHKSLMFFIWAPLIQHEFDAYKFQHNTHRVRLQKEKMNPSGCSPEAAYEMPFQYGGEPKLIHVDEEVVRRLMEDHPGFAKLSFYSKSFGILANDAYTQIGSPEVLMDNAWEVFRVMLPHVEAMYAENVDSVLLF